MLFEDIMRVKYPSAVIQTYRKNKLLPPEIEVLINVPQDKHHHPEGSAYIHTLLVMDMANEIAIRETLNEYSREILVLSALCHDLGKATTTVVHEDGRITAYGHPEAGIIPTMSLLQSMNVPENIIEKVIPLVREHMAYVGFYTPEVNQKAIYKLMQRLKPTDIHMLAYLVEADCSGRGGTFFGQGSPDRMKQILEVARNIESEIAFDKAYYPDNLITGDDIMSVLGIPAGKQVGKIKAALYTAQLCGDFKNKEEGLLYTLLHRDRLVAD